MRNHSRKKRKGRETHENGRKTHEKSGEKTPKKVGKKQAKTDEPGQSAGRFALSVGTATPQWSNRARIRAPMTQHSIQFMQQ